MREARLILPKQDNLGRCLAHMLDPVLDDVTRRFGGATVTEAFGVWMCPACLQHHAAAQRVGQLRARAY